MWYCSSNLKKKKPTKLEYATTHGDRYPGYNNPYIGTIIFLRADNTQSTGYN